jgi:hypothetical protein
MGRDNTLYVIANHDANALRLLARFATAECARMR